MQSSWASPYSGAALSAAGLRSTVVPHANNSSGCFIPRLGQLGVINGEAYRRWQQRMRAYQRHDTRSSSSSHRPRISSRRNDSNRDRNNHGGNPHESLRNNSRNNGQGNYNYASSSNAGSHALLLFGQDARNAGNTPQSLTVYQPNTGTPPALASAAGTPGIRYGATHNAKKTQTHASRGLFAQVVADRPMTVRPPSQFRL